MPKLFMRLAARLALATAGLAVTLPVTAQIDTARVDSGTVQGVVGDGIASFKGIPFAAPPVGELRWRAPQPVAAWEGTRAADRFGPSCMQAERMMTFLSAPPEISEDCLYLNVWTPADAPGEQLPVMVWIYGGGFSAGTTSSAAYDGTALAEAGVVLVSVNYRIGPFGFFAHPELADDADAASGNQGMADLIAGLEWVQRNIAAFGGDPGNVTIFGESAGAFAVSMLAASPRAARLFHKAIAQSGASFAPPGVDDEVAAARTEAVRFLRELGADSLAEGRALDAQVIQESMGQGLSSRFRPVADGDIVPRDIHARYSEGRFNDTPVIVGSNSDEGASFSGAPVAAGDFEARIREQFGEQADAILAAYPHSTDSEAQRSMRDLQRDESFAWPAWAWARQQAQHGEHEAYVYYFDHRTPSSPEGAAHAAEIRYIFGTLHTQGEPRPEDLDMASLIRSYWVNFARTGDPNGAGLPQWPAFRTDAPRAMVFDEEPDAETLPNLDKLEAFEQVFDARREALE